ncbi:hypothetical protein HMI54_011249 [Coelomomyces lativittatus]|nr:hypothetical protein HMI54_011249 [Coelomomyces lativittatus]
MSETYSVYYFPLKGRAEPIRMILEFGGAKYRNLFPQNWIEEKPKTPFGQLPVLIIHENGKEKYLAQSQAIIRYLARKFDLFPPNPFEAALVDSYLESFIEIGEKLSFILFRVPEDKREEAKRDFVKSVVAPFIMVQSRIIKSNKTPGYFLGNKITIADISLYNYVTAINTLIPNTINKENAAPLMEIVENVENHPRIKEYLNSDRRLEK